MPTEQPPADSGLTEIERLTAILDSDNGEPKAPEPDQEAEQADEVVEEEAPAEDGTEEASEEESPTEEEPEEEQAEPAPRRRRRAQ